MTLYHVPLISDSLLAGDTAEDRPKPDTAGRVFYDLTTNALHYDNGLEWLPINSASGGGASYPGVTGDGLTPGGLTIAGGLSVFLDAYFYTVNASGDGFGVAPVHSSATGQFAQALYGHAIGSGAEGLAAWADGQNSIGAEVGATGIGAQALVVHGDGWFDGGIGRYGHTPPAAPSSITGALSAVSDANTKAVLTSIIAALIDDGGAVDSTS